LREATIVLGCKEVKERSAMLDVTTPFESNVDTLNPEFLPVLVGLLNSDAWMNTVVAGESEPVLRVIWTWLADSS
jgi:hypothetical protein